MTKGISHGESKIIPSLPLPRPRWRRGSCGQCGLVYCEADGLSLGLRAEVVHARLEPLLPRIKVGAGELLQGRLPNEEIEGLTLADEGTPIS